MEKLETYLPAFLHVPLIHFGSTAVTLLTLIQFAILILLSIVAARYVRRLLTTRILHRTEQGLRYVVGKIVGYVVFAIGLLIGLQSLGINVTSFTLLAGALSVGIGFGLQNIFNNFVSGIILLSERLVQVGDRVEVGGTSGKVHRMGIRSSVLLTSDNAHVIVPNSEFLSGKVVNYGRGERTIRFDVTVGVDYSSDVARVQSLLLEIAAAHPEVLRDPAPTVELVQLGANAIDFRLFVSTETMTHHGTTLKSALYLDILRRFDEEGIVIPGTTIACRLV